MFSCQLQRTVQQVKIVLPPEIVQQQATIISPPSQLVAALPHKINS